jgi:hypothetical protein
MRVSRPMRRYAMPGRRRRRLRFGRSRALALSSFSSSMAQGRTRAPLGINRAPRVGYAWRVGYRYGLVLATYNEAPREDGTKPVHS